MDKKQMTGKKGYSPAENLDDGWDDLEIEDLEIEDLDDDSDGNEVDVEEAGMDTEETGDDYVEYDDEDEENEDEEDALGRKEKRLRVSIHLVLGILILGILGLTSERLYFVVLRQLVVDIGGHFLQIFFALITTQCKYLTTDDNLCICLH